MFLICDTRRNSQSVAETLTKITTFSKALDSKGNGYANNILGVSAFYHDSAVVLVDGEIVAACGRTLQPQETRCRVSLKR